MKFHSSLSNARKRIDPKLIEALANMSSIDTEAANQYKILLARINSDQKASTKMLKIVREFIREGHNFSLEHENALLKPIFTAIEEDKFTPSAAAVEDLDSKMESFGSEIDEVGSKEGHISNHSEEGTTADDVSDDSVAETDDLERYTKQAAQVPVLKQDLLDEFHVAHEKLNAPIESIASKRKRSVRGDSLLMAAIDVNDVGEVRKLLSNNAQLDEQVEAYTRENYPLMYMQLGTQYSSERRILGQLKIAKYADHIIENENIQAFMSSEQRYISDPYFDVDLFAKRLACANSRENNIVEKLANVKVSGAFKDRIDQIIDKIQNPQDIVIDGPATFAVAKAGSSIGR